MVHDIGISLPRRILIKRGAAEELRELLLGLKLGKKCTVFSDATTLEIVGNRIVKSISDAFVVDTVNPSSTKVEDIREVAERIRTADFCLAVGGGRAIDVCKYASWLASKPWVSFPTIPSHDGIVSSHASLEESGKRVSVKAGEPIAIVADLDVLRSAPYRYIAAGAGDCLSNLSAVEDWKRADRAGKEKYNEIIGGLAELAARAVIAHAREIAAQDYHGLEMLMWSLVSSGFAMNIYGSSRPASGSEHAFSHALDALGSRALHGEQVALGTIVSTYLQGGDWRKIKDVMEVLKLPASAKELGINEDIAIKALAAAKNVRERYTILNELVLDETKAREALHAVDII